jgi:hyperosmotically inducible protein
VSSFIRRSIVSVSLATLVAGSLFASTVCAYAQDAASAPRSARAVARSANYKLERDVRKALDRSKVDSSNIRVVAKAGKVSLDGTVPDASQIELAGTSAAGVQGVSTLDNSLIVATPGH